LLALLQSLRLLLEAGWLLASPLILPRPRVVVLESATAPPKAPVTWFPTSLPSPLTKLRDGLLLWLFFYINKLSNGFSFKLGTYVLEVCPQESQRGKPSLTVSQQRHLHLSPYHPFSGLSILT